MVSLHLLGLKGSINRSQARLNKAMKATDTARSIQHRQQQAFFSAKSQASAARKAERATRNEHTATVSAAIAEADSFRRQHTVGA